MPQTQPTQQTDFLPYLTVIGTLAGTLIGSLVTLLITWLNKRSEERKQFRELVVSAAVENWKRTSEMAVELGGYLPSLDQYIVYMIRFADVFLDKRVKSSEVLDKLNELDDLAAKIARYKHARETKETK